MGKLVVFWSPWSGRAGVTASICAVAAALSTGENALRTALTHTRECDAELEGRLDTRMEERRETLYEKAGLSALVLNFKQEELTKETVERCGILLPGSRLSLFPGRSDREWSIETEEILFTLFSEKLRNLYDMTLVDASPGSQTFSLRLLEAADVTVVVMPQHPYAWKIFKEKYSMTVERKNVLFLLGNYLEKAEYGERLFLKTVGKGMDRERLAVIPKNEEYLDAMADGRVIEFFLKNERAGRKEKNAAFMEQTEHAAKKLRQLAERTGRTGEVFVSGALWGSQAAAK